MWTYSRMDWGQFKLNPSDLHQCALNAFEYLKIVAWCPIIFLWVKSVPKMARNVRRWPEMAETMRGAWRSAHAGYLPRSGTASSRSAIATLEMKSETNMSGLTTGKSDSDQDPLIWSRWSTAGMPKQLLTMERVTGWKGKHRLNISHILSCVSLFSVWSHSCAQEFEIPGPWKN